MALKPGIHTLPAADYHADKIGDRPSLSRSIAHKLLAQSPLHAWHAHPRLNPEHVEQASGTLDNGTAAHTLMFEGVEAVIVEADSWRTNAAKEARDQARREGRVPLLAHQAIAVREMVDAVTAQLDALDISPRPFTKGQAEQTLIWEEKGVLCRARPDWLRDDGTYTDDLKTTGGSADPHEWARNKIWADGLDLQAAMVRRGVKALTGHAVDWRFVVVENKPPHALSVISLAPDALALADRKLDRALEIWKRCLDADEWPGYPPRIAFAELPPWEEARYLEKAILTDWDENDPYRVPA